MSSAQDRYIADEFAYGIIAFGRQQLIQQTTRLYENLLDCQDSTANLYNKSCSKEETNVYSKFDNLVRAELKCVHKLKLLEEKLEQREKLQKKVATLLHEQEAAAEALVMSSGIKGGLSATMRREVINNAENSVDRDNFVSSLTPEERREFLSLIES